MDITFDEMTQQLHRVQDCQYYKDKENCYEKKTHKTRKPRSSSGSIGQSGLLKDITSKFLKDSEGKGDKKKVNRYSGFGMKLEEGQTLIGSMQTNSNSKPTGGQMMKFR